MKQNPISRRYFLQGVGGSLLALPLLPSIMPKAYAESVGMKKFLVIIGSEHGGTGYRDWYPDGTRDPENPLSTMNTVDYLTGDPAVGMDHKIRWAYLRDLLRVESGHPISDPDGGKARLSYILGSHLNPYIDKMNFYQGIDLGPDYHGHGWGMISGSVSSVGNAGNYRSLPPHESMDYFLSRHPKFYGADSDHSVPAVVFPGRWLSIAPDKSRQPHNASSASVLYKSVFSKYEGGGTPDPVKTHKSFLIDRVLEDYNNLVKGAYGLGRKISSEDKEKVERHVANLQQVQKKYKEVNNSCSDITSPTINDWDTRLDLLVAAFNCGATRLSTIWAPITTPHPHYHHDVAHAATNNDPVAKEVHAKDMRWQSENVIGSLVKKLDDVEYGSGKTLLDSSLVFWQHESGIRTHSGNSVNLVSFGGAGGSMKTGKFLDYRNMSNFAFTRGFSKHGQAPERPGLLVQQWWSTVLRAMGMTPSDFEYETNKGFGPVLPGKISKVYVKGTPLTIWQKYHGTKGHGAYPQRIWDILSDKLPLT